MTTGSVGACNSIRAPVSADRLARTARTNWLSPSTSKAWRDSGCIFFPFPAFDSRLPEFRPFPRALGEGTGTADDIILICGIAMLRSYGGYALRVAFLSRNLTDATATVGGTAQFPARSQET